MPELTVEGRAVTVADGVTVLAALQNLGLHVTRRSGRGEARGALCGMGVCAECRALVNGVLVRTCLTTAQAGLTVERVAEVRGDR
ncbi:2Fe-2S iron-sulfur cluster-binding protein [Deinococcus radiotolerans]|uniref:Ferredoxin n=1 Tax=Deinococcus radiotolerans TaxID=1309407 RepID=A0ABQ2FLN4_9DEIO|nr:2Fe-2S iron-sulfur cluster-binding protein [Deinococcus radiotolerans]GGL08315.1 ferredoxin [Deinococcus radiotolerans]